MGLTLHQATRVEVLVKLVNSAVQCLSYEEVMVSDTAMTERNISRMDPMTGATIVPIK